MTIRAFILLIKMIFFDFEDSYRIIWPNWHYNVIKSRNSDWLCWLTDSRWNRHCEFFVHCCKKIVKIGENGKNSVKIRSCHSQCNSSQMIFLFFVYIRHQIQLEKLEFNKRFLCMDVLETVQGKNTTYKTQKTQTRT